MLYSRSLLVIHIIYSVYMLIPISKLIPHSFVDKLYSSENFKNKGKKKDTWRKEKDPVSYLVNKVKHEKIKTGMQNKQTFFSF